MERIQANKLADFAMRGEGRVGRGKVGVMLWEDRAWAQTTSPWVLLFPGHPAVFTEMVSLLPGAVFCLISISGQRLNATTHTYRNTHRHTYGDTDLNTDTNTHIETHTGTHTHRKTGTNTHTYRNTHRHTHTETHRHTTYRYKYGDTQT